MHRHLRLQLVKAVVVGLAGQVLDPHREVCDLHTILVNLLLFVVNGAVKPAIVDEPEEADGCVARDPDICQLRAAHFAEVVEVNGRYVALVLYEKRMLREV